MKNVLSSTHFHILSGSAPGNVVIGFSAVVFCVIVVTLGSALISAAFEGKQRN